MLSEEHNTQHHNWGKKKQNRRRRKLKEKQIMIDDKPVNVGRYRIYVIIQTEVVR